MGYSFLDIEKKWQEYWERNQTFTATEDPAKPKVYILDMFPYPSGSGLHVGHPEGYTATDVYSRYKRMRGFNVLHPMGWDAFGLPAERYAMQTGTHPRLTTQQNIDVFRRQIKMLGLSYDWSREISTTDPDYYKWTQWIFLKIYNSWYDSENEKARPISELPVPGTLFGMDRYNYIADRRLAYLSDMPVNWCPELATVLANEEVDEWVGKGYRVERRMMRQWILRITAYAERLEKDLAGLEWSAGIVEMQRNWIGRSTGVEADFAIEGSKKVISVFTTRADTMFGSTYVVLAPEHPLLEEITTPEQKNIVSDYLVQTKHKSELERTALDKVKSGVFTGTFAVNPATKKKIPVWIADYVILTYGTGAIMAVPGHDDRDYEFAKRHNLPVAEVVSGGDLSKEAFMGDGIVVNSRNDEIILDGLPTHEAEARMAEWLEKKGLGRRSVRYRLRDWLFSRQRYWGEPFPLVYREDGSVSALRDCDLPVLLPEIGSYKPGDAGEPPLATIPEWVNTADPETGNRARRETHTMPQWAGSCWYYLRFIDPHNDKEFVSGEKEKYWMPVDLYIGGAEHAVLHLLYARFWHKVLYDLGYVSTEEPFSKLINQGTILGEDGKKMSKSLGNVVNPDDVVGKYGADSMRLFEMFMGPLTDSKPWSTRGIEGVHRFLNRVWRMMIGPDGMLLQSVKDIPVTSEDERFLHQTIRKVTLDIEGLTFNTAISQMMIFVNEFLNREIKPRCMMETFVLLLSPFAPHIAEELWQKLGNDSSLAYERWPLYEESKAAVNEVEMVVQINGKIRSKFPVPSGLDEQSLKELALNDGGVKRYLDGKQIVRIVVVKNKLVNLVVK